MILPDNIQDSRILFSALNWGMGHVSRSIPILQQLIAQGNQITIFGTEEQNKIYKSYFESISFINGKGYPFKFSPKGFSSFKFIGQLAFLFRAYQAELKTVEKIQIMESFDYIISDQRYGFRSRLTKSIFITHQCSLALPWYLKIGQMLNVHLIKQFDFCWIIDDEKSRHAGSLSERKHPLSAYIGIKSRFSIQKEKVPTAKKYKVLLLNGPQAFHALLFERYKGITFDFIIGESNHPDARGIEQIQDWNTIDERILEAKTIYSFCGYSTLMDIQILQSNWECIPTPGQWEQYYLFKQKRPAD